MTQEQLHELKKRTEAANTITEKILAVKKEIKLWKQSIGINANGICLYGKKNNEIELYPIVYFVDFDIMKKNALANLNKRLKEFEKEFEEL